MLPMICITNKMFGNMIINRRFKTAEEASSKANAAVAPQTYRIAFRGPKFCTAANITILVGPGVKVTITQYSKKAVIFPIMLYLVGLQGQFIHLVRISESRKRYQAGENYYNNAN